MNHLYKEKTSFIDFQFFYLMYVDIGFQILIIVITKSSFCRHIKIVTRRLFIITKTLDIRTH